MSLDRLTKNAYYLANNCVTSQDMPASQAKKMIKELSPSKRKYIINAFKNPEALDPDKIDELDQEVENLINNNYTYKRKTSCRLSAIRALKNKFFSRTSSTQFTKEVLNHKPQFNTINSNSTTTLENIDRPTIETCLHLLGNLSLFILEEGLYLNEGFFRIPGAQKKVKKLHDELWVACKDGTSPSNKEILEIMERGSFTPDDFAGAFKLIARDILEFESALYMDYIAGLSDLNAGQKPKNLNDILLDHPDVHQNIMTLLRAITENEDITRLNEGALMTAFPACRSLFS